MAYKLYLYCIWYTIDKLIKRKRRIKAYNDIDARYKLIGDLVKELKIEAKSIWIRAIRCEDQRKIRKRKKAKKTATRSSKNV